MGTLQIRLKHVHLDERPWNKCTDIYQLASMCVPILPEAPLSFLPSKESPSDAFLLDDFRLDDDLLLDVARFLLMCGGTSAVVEDLKKITMNGALSLSVSMPTRPASLGLIDSPAIHTNIDNWRKFQQSCRQTCTKIITAVKSYRQVVLQMLQSAAR